LWVHRFNASGFTTFERHPSNVGRPIMIDGQQVRAVIRVALSRPQDLWPAVQAVVGAQAARILPAGRADPDDHQRMVASPPPSRGGLLPAHQDLETVTGPALRGQKNRLLDLCERCPDGRAVAASTSAARS